VIFWKILIEKQESALKSSKKKEFLHSYPQYFIFFKQILIRVNPLFFGTEEVNFSQKS